MTARRNDEALWEAYVRNELRKFYDHCDGETYLWLPGEASDRWIARLGGDSELATFKGPWHVIAPLMTTEFAQWVEEHDVTERLTPTQFAKRQREDRAKVAYLDSSEHTLDQLSELRRLTLERDYLIRQAAARGATKVAIARAIGLSRQQVHSIVATPGEELAPIAPIAPADEVATEWVQTGTGDWVEVF